MSSQTQVVWIHASGPITFVHDLHPVGYRAIVKFPRCSIRQPCLTIRVREHTIPVFVDRSDPYPTSSSRIRNPLGFESVPLRGFGIYARHLRHLRHAQSPTLTFGHDRVPDDAVRPVNWNVCLALGEAFLGLLAVFPLVVKLVTGGSIIVPSPRAAGALRSERVSVDPVPS